MEETWAEQEAENGRLRAIDYSGIPPLRLATDMKPGARTVRGANSNER